MTYFAGTLVCNNGSKLASLGSAGKIWLTQAMICGAAKLILQPVAVVSIWKDWLIDEE